MAWLEVRFPSSYRVHFLVVDVCILTLIPWFDVVLGVFPKST